MVTNHPQLKQHAIVKRGVLENFLPPPQITDHVYLKHQRKEKKVEQNNRLINELL